MTLGSAKTPEIEFNHKMHSQPKQAAGPQSFFVENITYNDYFKNIDHQSRKLLNQCLDTIRKVERAKSTCSFLKQCIKQKLVPKTFRINQTPDSRFSKEGKDKWEKNVRKLEQENIKLAVIEQSNLVNRLQLFVENRKTQIFQNIVDNKLLNVVKQEFLVREQQYYSQEDNNHQRKFFLLRGSECNTSENSPVQSQGQETLNSEVDSPHTSQQGVRKTRRFIKRSKYRRKQRKNATKSINNLFINFSSVTLSEPQQSLLNKHVSFVPLPDRVNTTQINYDISRFSRSLRWREYFGTQQPMVQENIIQTKKHNLPKSKPSLTLSKFIYGLESDIFSSKLKDIKSNLSNEENLGLEELVNIQKNGSIVIQRCDKGGAIAIMDRMDYISGIEDHLKSKVINQNGEIISVYREVDPAMLSAHYENIQNIVKGALTDNIISESDKNNFLPIKPSEARAYGLPKAHKSVSEGNRIPPLRLVISGSGSNTENASYYIDYHTKHIPESLDSHILDTPHFLRMLENENSCNIQDSETILVTIDVVGLYPNIPQNEGMFAFREKISDPIHRDQTIPTFFLMGLLDIVLTCNIFVFNGRYYIQEWGTAIGTRVAPTYANIFMGWLEEKLLKGWKGTCPHLWKRFIDDVFSVWRGTEQELLTFLEYINNAHPTIKFTAGYRTRSEDVKVKWDKDSGLVVNRAILGSLKPRSVDYLDTTVWIDEVGKFQTDLFVKETDKVTYLLPSSAHPSHITKNIPYSLGYRLKRICSSEDNFKIRREELKCSLKSRGYSDKVLENALTRVDKVIRIEALKKVVRPKNTERLIFATTYDPRLPSITTIVKKHYNMCKNDPEFENSFPEMPIVGYRRSKNLGEYLTRAKLYPISTSELRRRVGFQRCTRMGQAGCLMCHYSMNTLQHKSAYDGKLYNIQSMIKCTDTYLIYSIQCRKCPSIQYVGQTTQTASTRFSNHRSDVTTKKVDKPVSNHFNLPGHQLSDLVFLPFEKLRVKDKTMLEVRERYWISKKGTYKHGLNKC